MSYDGWSRPGQPALVRASAITAAVNEVKRGCAPPAARRAAVAVKVAVAEVIGSLHSRHRAIEFGKFLRTIDDAVPPGLDVHLVLASTHTTPEIKRWLAAHPHFHLHFTPTSSSWLNLVERWFAEPTTKKLQRSTHRPVKSLNTDIQVWIQTWNDNPRPYVWDKTADEILASVAVYCSRIKTQDARTGARRLD